MPEAAKTLRAAGIASTKDVFARRGQLRSSETPAGDLLGELRERLLVAIRGAALPGAKGGRGR